jgi:glycerophosphoryl diester phosphodiesterase
VRPLRIGHRGAPRLAPENTLASFEKALSLPHVDGIELDVHLSKDGRAVVIHDDTLERTTKQKGFVSERTAGELAPLGVSLLEDVLALVKAKEKRVFVELKMQPRFYEKLPSVVLGLLGTTGTVENAIVISFDHRSLALLKKEAPRVTCGALCAQRLLDPARYVKDYLGVDWWLPGAIGELDSIGFFSASRELDRASFEQCRERSVKTAVWTVNHPEQARAVAALGAEAVMSDDMGILELLA